MKYKQLRPKSVRPILSSTGVNKQKARCLLCDSLLKTSSSYRYLLMGTSIHEEIIIDNNKTITYAECCKRYLNEISLSDKLHMICPKCCLNLQNVHSCHLDAEELTKKICHTWHKTKRLNRVRHNHSIDEKSADDITIEIIKEEPPINKAPRELISTPVLSNNSYTLQMYNQAYDHIQASKMQANPLFLPPQTSRQIYPNDHEYCQHFLRQHSINNPSILPYSQFMIDSPTSSTISPQQQQQQQRNYSNNEPTPNDEDRSCSPFTNDDESGSKTTRLSRRQYDFLIQLPDQQSLNAFIEASSSESASRWTWRRTSANSRGYKIYYVCNFSMRRHYHPCPAAMYALFNPEGSISIFSCGQHQHIPKDRFPLTITDESKNEICKCLQTGMSTTDIRDHLIRLKLPFGDMRKLNNFIKYHKELLRFGTIKNIRVGATAYRQPQYWAIRRQSPTLPINSNTTS